MENSNNQNQPEEKFSEDPQENLRIENELLKLKMQAESGALFGGGGNLPPEVENEFLQEVQQFEDAWQQVNFVKVYDLLGRPTYQKIEDLGDAEVEAELGRLREEMAKKGVFLDAIGDYPPQVIYRFITEELFEHETDDLQLAGWTKNFIYEEFHPNHKMDIENRVHDFIQHWFQKSFNEYCTELSSEFVTPEGQVFTRESMLQKLHNCLAAYTFFSNDSYGIDEIKFEWNKAENCGLGHAQGRVRYDAVLEGGEAVHFEDTFIFYLSNEYGMWSILYFHFPGFAW